MQLAATRDNGAAVFVDYSHTPDALATALQALRPHVMGRLIVVFGAGGDRDTGKRAADGAGGGGARRRGDRDRRQPALRRSRRDPRDGDGRAAPRPPRFGDRAEAILRGVDALEPGDALLIAGKGHETGPGHRRRCAALSTMPNRPASRWRRWTDGCLDRALDLGRGRRRDRRRGARRLGGDGVSIDTRTLQPGDLFVALTDQRDGHDFVAQALAKGAAAALVSRVPEGVAADAPLLIVPDVLAALGRSGPGRAGAHARRGSSA